MILGYEDKGDQKEKRERDSSFARELCMWPQATCFNQRAWQTYRPTHVSPICFFIMKTSFIFKFVLRKHKL